MRSRSPQGGMLYRVWLIGFRGWQPRRWYDVPPMAVALEPAHDDCLSADEAQVFVQSFNEEMLAVPRDVWAVPVPVTMRYEGDLVRRAKVDPRRYEMRPAEMGPSAGASRREGTPGASGLPRA